MLKGKPILPVLFFILFLVYSMSVGCSNSNIFEGLTDDNTKGAKLEEAQIALDKGDFTAAINTLLDLCGLSAQDPTSGTTTCDNDTRALLASAYLGRAGLDVIKIIDTAVNTANTGTQGSIDTFTEFSKLLLNGKETDTHNAAIILSNIQNKTPDQNLQMAVAATADTVLIIKDVAGIDPTTGVPIKLPSTSEISTTASAITTNMPLITGGITGSGIVSANLTADINTIQTNISGADQVVQPTELQTYICNFIPKPTGC